MALALARRKLDRVRAEFELAAAIEAEIVPLIDRRPSAAATTAGNSLRATAIAGVYAGIEGVLREILTAIDGATFAGAEGGSANLLAQASAPNPPPARRGRHGVHLRLAGPVAKVHGRGTRRSPARAAGGRGDGEFRADDASVLGRRVGNRGVARPRGGMSEFRSRPISRRVRILHPTQPLHREERQFNGRTSLMLPPSKRAS